MKPKSPWLVYGICSVFALALLPSAAFAQEVKKCTEQMMMTGQCHMQNQNKEAKQAQQENKFPHATRKQPPKLGVRGNERKALNAGLMAANSGDSATALKDLQPIADSSSNAYAKAMAQMGLAQVKYHDKDTKGAIALQKQSIDSNALDNNSYFQGLEVLAQLYLNDDDYSNALTALNKWSKESGAQSADVEALKANAYYRLQKYPEAIAAIQKAKSLSTKPESNWDQIEMASYSAMGKYDQAAKLAEAALAKDPNNSALLHNVVAIYVNANQDNKALAVLERARANGLIKNEADYMNMAKMYVNLGESSGHPKNDAMKAVGVLKEGMSKGIVKPGYDSYKLLGDSYSVAGDYKNAAQAYGQASPQAKTGQVDFLRGLMLEDLGQHKQARDALKQAVAKGGFKRVGAAYLELGNAELALKDKAAAIAAYKQAEQDPGSRDDARRILKKLGHK
ncbi:MAG: tetratricopeptide repeat protein [Rhodanobacteraceae bacterium]